MSYAKAMKHARNVRKSRKQSRMYFGFDTGTPWASPYRNPELALLRDIRNWFKDRHFYGITRSRDCICAAIKELRALRKAGTAGGSTDG